MLPAQAFSSSYKEAREKFLHAATQARAALAAFEHPLRGVDGETLALDAALCGPADAQKLLIVSSGCHGVEGYCGSGAQIAALHDAALHARCAETGVALLFLHAINPYGFSHTRRVTHENVDLNRNFQDFSKPLPQNPAYRDLHVILLPKEWPPGALNVASLAWYIGTKGMKAAQQALSGGQYEVEDGLFFGGKAPTWSNRTLRKVLRQYGAAVPQVAWIDLHSGLGEEGECERTFAMKREDTVGQARARAWWEGGGATPLKSLDDGSSVSAALTGLMWPAIYDECPESEITTMAMEFGTVDKLKVLKALRGDHWHYQHPEAPAALVSEIKKTLRDAFYVDTPGWKEKITAQAMQAINQGVDGLSSS